MRRNKSRIPTLPNWLQSVSFPGGSGGVAPYIPAALFATVTATPAFVFGSVKMVSAYSGPAIRVLRPSDNLEADIPFAGNSIDETALVAHIGVQTGQIVRYYDQSGAGNHTDAQTDPARRAQIGPNYRQGGVLVTHHANTLYVLPAGLSFDRRNSSFYTASGGRNGPGGQFGLWRVGSAGDPYFLGQNGRALQTAGSNLFFPISRMVTEFHLSATGAIRSFNDLTDTNSALSAGTETGGTIGTADSSFFLNGDHDVFVGYASALSTGDRAAVKAALSAAFGGILTSGTRVIFSGDSITAGTGDPRGFGYAARASRVLPFNCYGAAEGGQQVVNFVANYNTGLARAILLAYPAQERVVFFHMGTNDLTVGGRTAAQIYADIQSYAGLVRADGGKIIVSTILPNNGWNGTQQTTRNDLNALIRANWASFADGFCDFADDAVMGPQAAAANTTLYGDGLHPAPQGHQNLSVLAANAINALFVPVAPVITGIPTIAGTTTDGQLLTATAAPVTGVPSPVRTWQWRRNGVDISGATASTYLLVTADVGATISVRQIETNSQGVDDSTSVDTAVIAANTGFSPADLSPSAWFRLMNSASVFQTTDTSTPITAPNETIGRLTDQSTNSRNATQGTLASRPTYSRVPVGGVRRNLFLQSEDILSSPWVADTSTFTANVGNDLDGNLTLDRVAMTTLFSGVRQTGLSIGSGLTYTISFDCRRVSGTNDLTIQSSAGNASYGTFNPTSTLTRYSITFTTIVASSGLMIQDRLGGGGVGTIEVGRFQLELGSTATPYQKVTTARDVTEVGLADIYYAFDDGGDSIIWTAPLGTYTIAYVVPNGTVTILTGQALNGPADALLPNQMVEYIAINRALTGPETTDLTSYLEDVVNP